MEHNLVNAFCITPNVFDKEKEKTDYILRCNEKGYNIVGFLNKGIDDLLRANWLMSENRTQAVILYENENCINLYEKMLIFSNENRLKEAGFSIATLNRGILSYEVLYDLMSNHEKTIIEHKRNNKVILVAWASEEQMSECDNYITHLANELRAYSNQKGYIVEDEFLIAQNSGVSEEVTRYTLYECLTSSDSYTIVTYDRENFSHCLDALILTKGVHMDYKVEFCSGESSSTLLDEILAFPYMNSADEVQLEALFTTKKSTFLFSRLGLVKEFITNDILFERIEMLKNKLFEDDMDVIHSALVTSSEIRKNDLTRLSKALDESQLEYIVVCDFPGEADLSDAFYKSRKTFKIIDISEFKEQGYNNKDIINKVIDTINDGYSLINILKSKLKNSSYSTFGGFDVSLLDVTKGDPQFEDNIKLRLSFEYKNSFANSECIEVSVFVLLSDFTKALIFKDKIKNTEFRGGNYTRFIIDRLSESNEFLSSIQKSIELLQRYNSL